MIVLGPKTNENTGQFLASGKYFCISESVSEELLPRLERELIYAILPHKYENSSSIWADANCCSTGLKSHSGEAERGRTLGAGLLASYIGLIVELQTKMASSNKENNIPEADFTLATIFMHTCTHINMHTHSQLQTHYHVYTHECMHTYIHSHKNKLLLFIFPTRFLLLMAIAWDVPFKVSSTCPMFFPEIIKIQF